MCVYIYVSAYLCQRREKKKENTERETKISSEGEPDLIWNKRCNFLACKKVDRVIASLVGANMCCPSGRSATFWVKTSAQPIIVSIPICHYDDTESAKAARRQLKETIYSVLFDMNVPTVCAINQLLYYVWATLALYAARRTTGIVVDIGFQQTSIVPSRAPGTTILGVLESVLQFYMNRCYVAFDYEAELSKDTQASFEVAAEGWFTLSKERFQTGEILFQPRIAGVQVSSLFTPFTLYSMWSSTLIECPLGNLYKPRKLVCAVQ
ncbi:actin-related protein 8-like [Actinidia eriantha]|uniref:actin-related protein 8-like n=1 Tax=Actinidia eriantha TaxID=165200 RepID=UPI0025828886|nr:actin-related protein 8-like [Actinidia eriantha]